MTVSSSSAPLLAGVFVFAFALAYGVIRALLRWWPSGFGADTSDGVRKLQAVPVLRVGGLAFYLVFIVAITLVWALSSKMGFEEGGLIGWPFLLFGVVLFLVGFADDLFGLSASVKLLAQVAVGVGAYHFGMSIEILTHPFGANRIDLGGFALVLTVAWFVAIPNLINLVDGMDGIAGGIGLFLSFALAVIGGVSGNGPLLLLSLMMAGGITAFLCFNLPPAKIYMGDGGAYLIGYFIAATSLVTSNKGAVSSALLVVVIALGFPILDTLLAMFRRWITGVPIMAPDALHLHHRLQTLGVSKRNLVFVLYGVFAVLSLLGLSVFLSAGYTLPVVGMVIVVAVLGTLRLLGLPHSVREAKRAIREMIVARKDVRYAYVMAQVLAHDLERISDGAVYWRQVRDFLSKMGIEPVPSDITESDDRRRRQCGGEICLVVFPLAPTRVWKLCCPAPAGSRRQWDRVIRCLQPAVVAALQRWGDPPPELGVWPGSPATRLYVESSLNGETSESGSVHPLQGRIAKWTGVEENLAER